MPDINKKDHDHAPITSRRKLAESLDTSWHLLESHPGVIFSLDLKGRCTRVSKTKGLSDCDTNELVGRHFSRALATENRRRARDVFRNVVQGESSVMETTILRQNTGLIDAMVTMIPIMAQEQVIGVHGTVQDISDRKRIERELRENEERYRRWFETSNDGILLT